MTDAILTAAQESEARLGRRMCIERDTFGNECELPLRIYARGVGRDGYCLRCVRHHWVAFGDSKPDTEW